MNLVFENIFCYSEYMLVPLVYLFLYFQYKFCVAYLYVKVQQQIDAELFMVKILVLFAT